MQLKFKPHQMTITWWMETIQSWYSIYIHSCAYAYIWCIIILIFIDWTIVFSVADIWMCIVNLGCVGLTVQSNVFIWYIGIVNNNVMCNIIILTYSIIELLRSRDSWQRMSIFCWWQNTELKNRHPPLFIFILIT